MTDTMPQIKNALPKFKCGDKVFFMTMVGVNLIIRSEIIIGTGFRPQPGGIIKNFYIFKTEPSSGYVAASCCFATYEETVVAIDQALQKEWDSQQQQKKYHDEMRARYPSQPPIRERLMKKLFRRGDK